MPIEFTSLTSSLPTIAAEPVPMPVTEAAVRAITFLDSISKSKEPPLINLGLLQAFGVLRAEGELQGSPLFASMMAAMRVLIDPFRQVWGRITPIGFEDLNAHILMPYDQKTTLSWDIWRLHFSKTKLISAEAKQLTKNLHKWKDLTGVLSPVAGIITAACNRAWQNLPRPNAAPHKFYLLHHPPTALRECIETLEKNFSWLQDEEKGRVPKWKKDARLILRLWKWMLRGAETHFEFLPQTTWVCNKQGQFFRQRITAPWQTDQGAWQHDYDLRVDNAQRMVDSITQIAQDIDTRLGKGDDRYCCGLHLYARLNEAAARGRLVREYGLRARFYRRLLPCLEETLEQQNVVEVCEFVEPFKNHGFPELGYIAERGKGHHNYFLPPVCYPLTADRCFPLVEVRTGSRPRLATGTPEYTNLSRRTEELFFLITGHQRFPRPAKSLNRQEELDIEQERPRKKAKIKHDDLDIASSLSEEPLDPKWLPSQELWKELLGPDWPTLLDC